MAGLSKELGIYQNLLPSLMKDEGKYAVIFQDRLVGVFSSYDDAIKVGYQNAKLDQFLVKKIATVGAVSYFTRDIDTECPITH